MKLHQTYISTCTITSTVGCHLLKWKCPLCVDYTDKLNIILKIQVSTITSTINYSSTPRKYSYISHYELIQPDSSSSLSSEQITTLVSQEAGQSSCFKCCSRWHCCVRKSPYMHSTPSLCSLTMYALKTVPVLVCLTTDHFKCCSRWHYCVRKSPYAFHSISLTSHHVCPKNSSSVGLLDDRPFLVCTCQESYL